MKSRIESYLPLSFHRCPDLFHTRWSGICQERWTGQDRTVTVRNSVTLFPFWHGTIYFYCIFFTKCGLLSVAWGLSFIMRQIPPWDTRESACIWANIQVNCPIQWKLTKIYQGPLNEILKKWDAWFNAVMSVGWKKKKIMSSSWFIICTTDLYVCL